MYSYFLSPYLLIGTYIECFVFLGITWRVNITSIICIIYAFLNTFGPMEKVNVYIFGSYDERVSETAFSV
jgi:hypothetical protein